MPIRQFGALLLVSALGLFATRPALAQDSTVRELTRLEDAWSDALVAHDGAAVGRMLADDYTFVGPDGNIIGKAEVIQQINEDETRFLAGGNRDVRVRVYGNSAVVTGLWTGTVATPSGREQRSYRWTDTWAKGPGGTWLCVAGQSNLVPD